MSSLPPAVQALIDLIGYDATMAIVKTCGGQRLLIPVQPTGPVWSAILRATNPEQAATVQKTYKGSTLYIPRCQTAITHARWAAIQRDYDAGAKIPQLVAQYGLSYRQVETILSKPTQPQPSPAIQQLSLL